MDNKWLKTQFKLNPDKTKAGLAKALDLPPPAVSKILAGTRQIKAAEYHRMRKFFGLPVDGEAATSRKAGKDSLVVSSLSDAADSLPDESWVMPVSLLSGKTKGPPEKIRVFTVQDATMAPDFAVGEKILVDMDDTKPSPPGVFVVSDGFGYIIRQCEIVPQSSPAKIRMTARSGDPFVLPLNKAGIAGRVIAKLEWLK